MEAILILLIAFALSVGFALIAATGYIQACGEKPKKNRPRRNGSG